MRYLEHLSVAVRMDGWRCVKLYRDERFPVSAPLLWVYASGVAEDVGVVVEVRAVPGNGWAYYERSRYLFRCGDVNAAAERVGRLLRHRMFPATW
ncbi:hypothetical protein [Actinomadura napierensis]|uniref:hypothetical protein n=1 Tax=Actinomadura napierensis TaxID=267854 RepID=UPI0031D2E9F3